METFWFFQLRFRQAYDSAYDSYFRFSLGHKLSCDSDYDSNSNSVASENQPLVVFKSKLYKLNSSTVLAFREMLEQSSDELENTIRDLEEKNDSVEDEGRQLTELCF